MKIIFIESSGVNRMWIAIFMLFITTIEESKEEQQYFRLKPQNKEAVQGDTVEFHCHVENVAGDVQWSKDGFLLGFESNIPGYPRYFMVINTTEGIYNLRIEDVQLEDEAEFQCQVIGQFAILIEIVIIEDVGPSGSQKPIRAEARLSVVIPPKNVTINGLSDGEEVMVRESQKLVLSCKTIGSKPPAEMKWYRKTVELVPEAAKTSIMLKEGKGFITTSSLILYPKLEETGTTYTCEVFHQTLDKPIKTTVSVGILYPPTQPIIEGYQEEDFVQIGDTVVLICSTEGGKPTPRLVWYRNDLLIDTSYSTSGNKTTNMYSFMAKSDDNNAEFRCLVTNAVTDEPLFKSVKLRVIFGPKNLTISGPSEARHGETIFLNCQSDYSNPSAQLSWVVDNKMEKSAQTETYQTTDGWVTSSNLSLLITRQDVSLKIISCYASAIPLRPPMARIHTVVIKYPPDSPMILGYEKTSVLKEGDIQRLTCVALGGNPPAYLQWYKGDKEITAPVFVSGSGVSSELLFQVDASDNGVVYRCRATHPAIIQPLETAVTLRVSFLPKEVIITVKPKIPKEGQKVTISCQTSTSNPLPKVTWLKNNKIEKQYNEETVNSTQNGFSVRSELIFVARSSDDGTVFTCQANIDGFEHAAETDITLRVLYKPKFFTVIQKKEVVEGESIEVNMTAHGNPNKIKYKWYKDETLLPTKYFDDGSRHKTRRRLMSLGPLLYVINATRNDTSIYTCEAENDEGTSNATLVLNIHYPAVVTNISLPSEVKEGDEVNFECSFDGNPLPEKAISWRKDGNLLLQHIIQGKKSYLKITNITRKEDGYYECIADNKIGNTSVQTTRLSVIHRPVIHRSRLRSKVASDLKDTAKFRCISDSYSNTSIKWSYKDMKLERNLKYEMKDIFRNSTFESTLLVKQLEETDFGIYKCIAVNPIGKDSFQFLLVKRGSPEPPLDLTVVNLTNTNIIISWKSGFDGGYVPSFRVRYRQQGTEKYFFQNVITMKLSHKIAGLKPGTEYCIAVSAWNDLGHSNFTSEIKVSTTDVVVMDSTLQAPEKKSKEVTGTSKWLWICAAAVGTIFVMVILISMTCLIQKERCCTRSTAGHQPARDVEKQVSYTVDGETFYITRENLSQDDILMEKIKDYGRSKNRAVEMIEEKVLETTDWKLVSEDIEEKGYYNYEELIRRSKSCEYMDIFRRNDEIANIEEQRTESHHELHFSRPQTCSCCLSQSITSLHSAASSRRIADRHNIALSKMSGSSCDLRIRHILFEPGQPSSRILAEELNK